MRAIVTIAFWAEVDDHEEASQIAAGCDSAVRLQVLATLDRNGAERADLEGHVGYLGTSYWMMDESQVA